MTIRSTHHVNPDILYRSSRTIETKDDFRQKEEQKKTDEKNQKSSDQK